MGKFGWAFIGSGQIAKTVAQEILKSQRHEIKAVFSRNFEHAKVFAKKFNAIPFEKLDDALNCPGVDGVYICTVHTAHKEEAIQALKLKKPVLLEKPAGINKEEVADIMRAAKENDTYLSEAMWTWFSDVALEVKSWIAEGRIGGIIKGYGEFSIPRFLFNKNSRVVNPLTAGGPLLDIGIYPLTYAYNLFGMPKKIVCDGVIKDGIDRRERITMKYESFDFVVFSSLESRIRDTIKIVGSIGTIQLPFAHMASKAIIKDEKKTDVYHGQTSYLVEFDRVAQEIRKGQKESNYVPLKSTLDVMTLMDECRNQMALIYPNEKR